MLYNKDWEQPKINPVSDVLLKAADLIEQKGHTKNARKTRNGFCFLGALEEVQGTGLATGLVDTLLTYQASEAVAKMLGLSARNNFWLTGREPTFRDYRGSMAIWNNAPERTAQEVIDIMRKAARQQLQAEVKEIADAV